MTGKARSSSALFLCISKNNLHYPRLAYTVDSQVYSEVRALSDSACEVEYESENLIRMHPD